MSASNQPVIPNKHFGRSSLDWIRNEYKVRRVRNPSYSLRAFAKSLKVAPGRLSEILATKRGISFRMAERFAEQLGLEPSDRQKFLSIVEQDRAVSLQSLNAARRKPTASYQNISEDNFNVIADWHHLAILSLIGLKTFQEDARWIARRLGISVVLVQEALERLERLGMTRRIRGQLKPALNSSFHEVSSIALRKFHHQRLELAQASLHSIEPEFRDITAITMNCSLSKIPVAKTMIKSFRRQLSEFLESGPAEEVFGLNIQLIPLTKIEKNSSPLIHRKKV